MYSIKFSPETITVLENFAQIHPSLLFRKGSKLSVISGDSKAQVFAVARIPEEIQEDFAIYRLNDLLAVLSVFKNPEVLIDKNFLLITEDTRQLKFVFADLNSIDHPDDEIVDHPELITSFTLKNNDLAFLHKVGKLLNLPEVALKADGSKITINAFDSASPTSNLQKIDIADTSHSFDLVIDKKNLVFVALDYKVDIYRGFVKFTSVDKINVEYYVCPILKKSRFI